MIAFNLTDLDTQDQRTVLRILEKINYIEGDPLQVYLTKLVGEVVTYAECPAEIKEKYAATVLQNTVDEIVSDYTTAEEIYDKVRAKAECYLNTFAVMESVELIELQELIASTSSPANKAHSVVQSENFDITFSGNDLIFIYHRKYGELSTRLIKTNIWEV